MPLTATNFVNKGPVLHNDLLQFFNLFTGVMVDQPVTFKNTVSVGGSQGMTTVPVKLYGAVGQTTHLLDLYADTTNAQPGWGIAATGVMQWGPGGVAPVDTTLSRVGTQNGHATDTAGLLIQPYLDLAGTMQIDGTLNWKTSGGSIAQGAAGSLLLTVTQDLQVARNLIIANTALPDAIVTNQKLASDTARLNLLTNGGFEIWQRGTSFSGGGYFADRWITQQIGTDSFSVSRGGAGTTDTGSRYSAGCTFTLGSGAGGTAIYQQLMAADHSLAGKTLYLSVRVATATANAIRVRLNADGTGAPSSYSTFHPGGGGYQTLTAGPITVPTDYTNVIVAVYFAASTNAYVDNAMLVVGSQYADYAPLHPADDLARCLRYYEMVGGPADTSVWFEAYASTANQTFSWPIGFKAQKAVTPTATIVGTWVLNNCTMTLPVGAGVSTSAVRLTSSAAGQINARNIGAGTTLTFEANP